MGTLLCLRRWSSVSLVAALAACSADPDFDSTASESALAPQNSPKSALLPDPSLPRLSDPALLRASTDGRVSANVLARIQEAQQARVLISFNVPNTVPETPGSEGRVEANIKASEQIYEHLLRKIDSAKVVHRLPSLKALALIVDADDLESLLSEQAVTTVSLDEDGGSGFLREALPLTAIDQVKAAGLSGQGITVAVLDSGVDRTHPALATSVVDEACFCSGNGGCCPDGSAVASGPGSAIDDHGHGSHVSGIIASNGSGGAPEGAAPNVDIVAVKVLDKNNRFCCSSDILAALDYILREQPEVDIINASLGTFARYTGSCDDQPAAEPWKQAIVSLRERGVLLFAASGNDGSADSLSLPACVSDTIAVGAVWDSDIGRNWMCDSGERGEVACFSNSSSALDLLAPGAPIVSVRRGGGAATYYGTSQASPIVAGCAALLLEKNPELSPSDVEALLKTSTHSVTDPRNGLSFPRLDCQEALLAMNEDSCDDDCSGRECGLNDCGNSCGSCEAGEACTASGQCEPTRNTQETEDTDGSCSAPAWQPDRAYQQGDRVSYDGQEYLAAHWSYRSVPRETSGGAGTGNPWLPPVACSGACIPDCEGKQCGDDSCGNSCGSCASDQACTLGICTASNESDCSVLPHWVTASYPPGARVVSEGRIFQCKAWPFSGWCGISTAYEPGVGRAYRDAWDEVGTCN